MNAKRTRYTAGFPTGALVPGSSLARYERYDNTTQQILDLQKTIQATNDTVAALQDQLLNMKTDIVVRAQVATDSPNLIANGDCSQWSLHKPIVGLARPNVMTRGWMIQNRTIPIMDRWYHIASLKPLSLGNDFTMTANQVAITTDPALGSNQPTTAKYGLEMNWSGTTTGAMDIASPTKVVYGVCGIQHRIPDVTQFQNNQFTLSFWIKSTHAFPVAVVVHRQYNEARPIPGGATGQTFADNLRPRGLEYIGSQVMNSGLTWQQFSTTFTFGALNSSLPIAPNYNGLLIQICPFYYSSYVTDLGETRTFAPAGTEFHSATIDCDFTITEIQLLPGTTTPAQFYSRIDESAATKPYIQAISPATDPSLSSAENMEYGSIARTTSNLDADGINWPIQRFILPFKTPMIQKPGMVLFTTNGNTLGTILMNRRRMESATNVVTWDADTLTNAGDNSLCIFNQDAKATANMVSHYGACNFTGLNVIQDQCKYLVDENVTIMTGAKPLPVDSGSPAPQGSIGIGTLTFPTAFPAGTNPTVFVSPYTSDTSYFYSCKITDTSNTGFNYNWWRRDTATSAIQNNGPLSMFWIAFADVAEGSARSVAITQGNWPSTPSGHTVVNFTNQQLTYTGNALTGTSYVTGNITQVRRLTYNNLITTTYQLGIDIATPPPAAVVDSYHGHTTSTTRVEHATLQLDPTAKATLVAIVNEFDFGRPNLDDWFTSYDYSAQSIYTVPYYPNPTN
jgi:hypothetical protein